VRGDIEDYREMAASHRALLEEAGHVSEFVAQGAPVAVVLDQPGSPLLDLADRLVGYPKLFFVRPKDPYGLIDTAALFEWVIAEEGTRVQHVVGSPVNGRERGGVVLLHSRGAFVDRGRVDDITHELTRWQESGRSTRLIQAVALN
jgi:hypothetical protein